MIRPITDTLRHLEAGDDDMSKPYPALCAECKHSEPEENSTWSLRCTHPKVNGNDPWALASARKARGTDCRGERERRSLFAVCGIKGKAWEPRPIAAMTEPISTRRMGPNAEPMDRPLADGPA